MNPKKILSLLAITLCTVATPELALASRADFVTAYNYTIRYLPRFQTYASQIAPNGLKNTLIGPENPMSPSYKAVVAINVDTLYTSATLNLTDEPQILTIPAYQYSYSIVQVDVFGTILTTGLEPTMAGGTYALVGPGYSGELPSGVTKIQVPQNWTQLAIRTDRYTLNGTSYIDTQTVAEAFRKATRLQSLTSWLTNPLSGGETQILSISDHFATPMKTAVDLLAQSEPKAFLDLLQAAMGDPSTTPLSDSDKTLINIFKEGFLVAKAEALAGSISNLSDICAGARAAHDAILANWHFHTIGNNWVHFNNMGNWGADYLDRSSGNLFIQYGNTRTAAYYAQAFLDNRSAMLTGAGNNTYTITFEADQLPQYKRFWSITAYTSDAIELVPNAANKYAVAAYTPGLVKNGNGSVTITLKTIGDAETSVGPNVLPIPAGRFSVMLRVYGPLGAALDGTYVPPAVVSQHTPIINPSIPVASEENATDWLGGLKAPAPETAANSGATTSEVPQVRKTKKGAAKNKLSSNKKANGGSKQKLAKKSRNQGKKITAKNG
jgi:hypothetical protein